MTRFVYLLPMAKLSFFEVIHQNFRRNKLWCVFVNNLPIANDDYEFLKENTVLSFNRINLEEMLSY